MTPSYALQYNSAGTVTGVHQWADSTTMILAADEIECTQAQYANSSLYSVVNGVITESLAAVQAQQAALITQSATSAIDAGFTSSANGTALFYTLANNDQRRALMTGQVATQGMASATAWAASTPYAVDATILVDGVYYVCVVAGTSGTAIPTAWPTAFATPITDGTCEWCLFGLQLKTLQNGVKVKVWLTPQQITKVLKNGTTWVNACDQQLAALVTQVQAATTVADVQAVVWSNP